MKLFDGLGELDADLGEPRPRKSKEKTFFPPSLVSFVYLIKTPSGLTVAPLYLSFIWNGNVSKNKDTNFVRATLLSKTDAKENKRGYRKQKDIEVL